MKNSVDLLGIDFETYKEKLRKAYQEGVAMCREERKQELKKQIEEITEEELAMARKIIDSIPEAVNKHVYSGQLGLLDLELYTPVMNYKNNYVMWQDEDGRHCVERGWLKLVLDFAEKVGLKMGAYKVYGDPMGRQLVLKIHLEGSEVFRNL